VDCVQRYSFVADEIETQLGEYLQGLFHLTDAPIDDLCRTVKTNASCTPTDATEQQRGELQRARFRLDEMFPHSQMSLAEYQRSGAALDAEIASLPAPLPVELFDIRGAAEKFRGVAGMWFHPGTTLEHRRAFV
jgi:hypothetical protein